jgi:gluconate kinase
VAEALIITGPCGAGKSTTGFECLEVLERAEIPAAMIDAELVYFHPAPAGDPMKEAVAEKALAALWAIYRAEGIERLLLPRVLMRQNHLELVRRAVPDARLTIAWLDTPEDVIARRLGEREQGAALEWHLHRAAEIRSSGMREQADFAVPSDQPVREVAASVLRQAGWLTSV